MDLEIATKAIARRQRRPILRPKLPQRLPGDIARRAGALGPQDDRKAQPPSRPDHHVGVVLEHRDIRQVDRILLETSD